MAIKKESNKSSFSFVEPTPSCSARGKCTRRFNFRAVLESSGEELKSAEERKCLT